ARRALGAGEHQHLAREALSPLLVPHLDDGAGGMVDAAPAGDGVACDERLAFGDAAHNLASLEDDLIHRNRPSYRCAADRSYNVIPAFVAGTQPPPSAGARCGLEAGARPRHDMIALAPTALPPRRPLDLICH